MAAPVRWGILGTGTVAGDFAAGLQAADGSAAIVAVASRSADRVERFASAFGIRRTYSSSQALVADPDVDVVYIATPTARHREHCLLALSAGKAVLCEKPLAASGAEAREIVACARQARVFCMEGMWMRFLPVMRELRGLLDQNAIGDIRMLSADLGFAFRYDPADRRFNAELGGGAFLDLGIYALSLAAFVMGTPDRVAAHASIGPTGVDHQSVALLHYADGRLASLAASYEIDLPGEALIVGTRGRIRVHAPLYRPHRLSIDRTPGPVTPSRPAPGPRARSARDNRLIRALYFKLERPLRLLQEQRRESTAAPFEGNGYNYEAAEVMRCLREGRTESPLMPLDESISVLETADRIRAAWLSAAGT